MRVNDVLEAAKEAGWKVIQDSKVGKSEEEVGVVTFKQGETAVTMAVVKARRPEGALRFVRGKKEDGTRSSEGSLEDTAIKLLGASTVARMKDAEEEGRSKSTKAKAAKSKAAPKSKAKAAVKAAKPRATKKAASK